MSVSIAILNWNGKAFLRRSIEAALAQTAVVDEIFVIDNDSSDESWMIAEEMGIRLVHADNAHGFITGLNVAFSVATSDKVFFMSNDVFPYKNCLSEMLLRTGIVWPRFYTEQGKELERGKKTIMTAAFLMSRADFKRIGDFDVRLAPAYMEDLDYSIRAKKLGIPLHQCMFAHAIHLTSASFKKAITKRQISKLCRKHRVYVLKKHYHGLRGLLLLSMATCFNIMAEARDIVRSRWVQHKHWNQRSV